MRDKNKRAAPGRRSDDEAISGPNDHYHSFFDITINEMISNTLTLDVEEKLDFMRRSFWLRLERLSNLVYASGDEEPTKVM